MYTGANQNEASLLNMTNPTHQTEGLRNIGLPLIQVYSKAVQRPTAVKWTKVLYKSCHILTFTHTCTHWWQRLPCRKSACSRGDTALPIQSDAWYIYAQPFTSCLRTLHSKSCNFVQFQSFAIFKKTIKIKHLSITVSVTGILCQFSSRLAARLYEWQCQSLHWWVSPPLL